MWKFIASDVRYFDSVDYMGLGTTTLDLLPRRDHLRQFKWYICGSTKGYGRNLPKIDTSMDAYFTPLCF